MCFNTEEEGTNFCQIGNQSKTVKEVANRFIARHKYVIIYGVQ